MTAEETQRKALATLLVERMYELSAEHPELPKLVVHWDDCDMEYRRFWFHFRRPGLTNIKETGSPCVRDCAKLIWMMKQSALKFIKEWGLADYAGSWYTESKPEMKYRCSAGETYAIGYKTDTWVYVLSFYG